MTRLLVLLGAIAVGGTLYASLSSNTGHYAKVDKESRAKIAAARQSGDKAEFRKAVDEDNNLATYDIGDDGINAARAKGKATLPRFVELMTNKTPGNYTVKYGIRDGAGNVEHVWVQVSDYDSSRFTGRVANEPVIVTSYKLGDSITVPYEEASDWMIASKTAIYGGYTMRHSLSKLPKEQAAQISSLLRD